MLISLHRGISTAKFTDDRTFGIDPVLKSDLNDINDFRAKDVFMLALRFTCFTIDIKLDDTLRRPFGDNVAR